MSSNKINTIKTEVLIIGAGAAGLMCAIEAAKRSRQVVVLEQANKPGKKILMSGGGRCNFTNLGVTPAQYLSHNPHFCKSALSRYTQWDFIEWVKRHNIPFHEKTLGQLFCDNHSKDIVNMLLTECAQGGVELHLNTMIEHLTQTDKGTFIVKTKQACFETPSLVIATGGLSIPTMGSSPFGYKVAEQFDIPVWPTRAGLVPLTLDAKDKEKLSPLSGIANMSVASVPNQAFKEGILLTHRGLSGPAILQISSYWIPGQPLTINWLPDIDLVESLKLAHKQSPTQSLKTALSRFINKKIASVILEDTPHLDKLEHTLSILTYAQFEEIGKLFHEWVIKPGGTEGYRTAEVTMGGVDCDALSSKTMEAKKVPGLYFIGEVVDVSGWLGGYNFQWAWSSGWAAGQVV